MNKKYIETAREVLQTYGSGQSIDLQHLLAVLIGPKATPELCGALASRSIQALSEMTAVELRAQGLTETQAQRVMAGFQVGRKWSQTAHKKAFAIRSPEDAYRYLRMKIGYEKQEVFYVLYLNTKNEVIYEKAVFKGSLNASIVHPREVFRPALQHASASLICGHNHPSGHPDPSREDIDVTKRLAECGKVMGIDVLDHIIACEHSYVSLKEKGYL